VLGKPEVNCIEKLNICTSEGSLVVTLNEAAKSAQVRVAHTHMQEKILAKRSGDRCLRVAATIYFSTSRARADVHSPLVSIYEELH